MGRKKETDRFGKINRKQSINDMGREEYGKVSS